MAPSVLITYLVPIPPVWLEEAEKMASDFIAENYGENYLSQGENTRRTAGKIQDAHEAIRPTNLSLTPVKVKESPGTRPVPPLPADLEALHGEPHVRAAVYETTSVKIGAGGNEFTMTASRLKFDGFKRPSISRRMRKREKNQIPPKLEKVRSLSLLIS